MRKLNIFLSGMMLIFTILISFSFVKSHDLNENFFYSNTREFNNFNDQEVRFERKALVGKINYSLFSSFTESIVDPDMAMELSHIFQIFTDYGSLQKGDFYKVVYEEEYAGNKLTGNKKILGVNLHHQDKDYFAFKYFQNNKFKYFNYDGKATMKLLLKTPLNYKRISSHFSLRRFHPILRRYKAHLGTDFAAPIGTPIKSAGDGKIIAMGYNRGNGRYIKIKHNETYTTQYLHMSKFAKGMRWGSEVKQGEVIGYVGMSGLATGPHLCFRFWKNGKQIDPFNDNTPREFAPIKKNKIKDFKIFRNEILNEFKILGLPLENAVVSLKNKSLIIS